jgi:hypothetical protein
MPWVLESKPIHDRVVKAQQGEMELGDDEVLVIARVADERTLVEGGALAQIRRKVILVDNAKCKQSANAR